MLITDTHTHTHTHTHRKNIHTTKNAHTHTHTHTHKTHKCTKALKQQHYKKEEFPINQIKPVHNKHNLRNKTHNKTKYVMIIK